MNFLEAFNNKSICIPLLQRDYVQGGEESVIVPFLDSLLDSKPSDLNYIYGYTEDGCFVPVDGQQRLTTLWLLHLYLFARFAKKEEQADFNVALNFLSREYAADFCHRLQEHLHPLLQSKAVDKYESLDLAIMDQPWFISSWKSNVTVKNMLGTLKHIHQKVTKKGDCLSDVISTPTITFAFLNMSEENGLDDDIYIKMNGRGRPLSVFENLKSWMDEQVSKAKTDDDWKAGWQKKMDNKWTGFFWNNRNKNQEHPEEIDDEQLFCFCNLLILYWTKNMSQMLDTLSNLTDDSFLYEGLMQYLEIKEEGCSEEIAARKILDNLQHGNMLPIIWIERLKLMPEGFFQFAFNSLDAMADLSKVLNDLDIYLGEEKKEGETTMYQLALCESSYGRTLPLFYAVLAFKDKKLDCLKDWLRTLRNLILNTNIEYKDLAGIIKAIESLATETVKQGRLYEALLSDNIDEILKGFSPLQIREEKKKAEDELAYLRQEMCELENSKFFRGKIGFMFDFFQAKEGYDELSKENFANYSQVLLTIFDGSQGGINAIFDDSRRLLRRALMTFPPYYFGVWRKKYWCFCETMEEWRNYVNRVGEVSNQSLRLLVKNICLPALKNNSSLEAQLSEYVGAISDSYEEDLRNEKEENKFRFHFIRHPQIWDYMVTKCVSWNSEFDIILRKNQKSRMELRTYALYLDYAQAVCGDLHKDWEGWKINIYPRDMSCFHFDRDVKGKDDKVTIAIDVYFYDDDNKRTKENEYAFDLFLRIDSENVEIIKQVNKEYFSAFGDLIAEHNLGLNMNGRYHSPCTYSRDDIISVLGDILRRISAQTLPYDS